MEAIQAFSDRVDAAFESIGKSVDGVVADVDALKKQIADLQSSPGAITPEDQARLDKIEATANNVASKLSALDAATETPPAPTV